MTHIRPIDSWFIAEVLPHEAAYLSAARRLCAQPSDAHDLVQEAYARLFEHDGWQAIHDARVYVCRMLHNLAVQKMRRAKIIDFRQLSDIDAFDPADEAPDAFRVAAAREEMTLLRTALHALPERCREVVVMRRFADCPPREIAHRLGLSISTMEKRLARGLALLAHAIEAPARVAPPAPAAKVDPAAADGDAGRDLGRGRIRS